MRLAIALAALAMMGAAQSQPPQRGNSKPNSNSATATSAPADQPSTINQIFGTANDATPPRTTQQGKLQQALEKAETDPVVWATVVIAVFAGWQVAIYRKMLKTTRIVERAYVYVSRINLPHFKPGERFLITCTVRNAGKTPGDIKSVRIAVNFLRPEATDFTLLDVTGTQVEQAGSIVGEQELTMGAWSSESVSAQRHADVINAQQRMIVTGVVTYKDRFEAEHDTDFGREYDAVLSQGHQRPIFGHLRVESGSAKGYNDAN
jgi:hypothetical protein